MAVPHCGEVPRVERDARTVKKDMSDEIFENPRLAAIYDALDADRRDLDVYVAFAEVKSPDVGIDL
jgi:hypothetical protein